VGYAGEAGPGYYDLTRDTASAFVASVMEQGVQAVVGVNPFSRCGAGEKAQGGALHRA